MLTLTGLDEACVILSSMVTYAAARGSSIPGAMSDYANGGGKDHRRAAEEYSLNMILPEREESKEEQC